MIMKITKTGWWIIGTAGVAGLGIGGYFLWQKLKKPETDKYGNPLLKGEGTGGITGGVETSKEGGTAITEPNWDNPFDVNYHTDVMKWVAPRKIYLLKSANAKQYAKELHDAWGGSWYINDDESAVKAVFSKKVSDKVHVSCVAKAFWETYKQDLYEYLANFLSEKEMQENVRKPVQALPNYRISS